MNNENDEGNNQYGADDLGSDPDVPITPLVHPEHTHHPAIEAQHGHHYIKRSFQFVQERWPTANAWSSIGSLITAAATIVMVIVYFQIKQIMNSQGGQTEKLITAANTQACAAKSFAASAANINTGVTNAVTQLNLQATRLQGSVEQATRLANATDKANANVLNADRPWMGAAFGVDKFTSGATPTYTVVFTNSGKRPARVTLTEVTSVLVDYGNNPVYPPYDVTPSISVAVPGQPLTTTWKEVNAAMNPIGDTLLKSLAAGSPFRVYAKIEYTDIRTNAKYWTHACWRYTPNQSPNAIGFSNCTEYNDAK